MITLLILSFLFIATLSSNDHCPKGYTFFENTKSCYRATHWGANYPSVVRICKEEGDTQLVTVHSEAEAAFVSHLEHKDHQLGYYNAEEVWLGMHWNSTSNTWITEDGLKVDYFNWAPGMPLDFKTNPFVVMDTWTSLWRNVPLNYQVAFLCICKTTMNKGSENSEEDFEFF